MANFAQLRKQHLKINHDLTFYPYQRLISDTIINALNKNLRLVNHATEEDIKKLTPIEIPIEISRQAGKTEAIVDTVEVIVVYLSKHYGVPIHVGIFAPQIEQSRTDFERLKEYLRPIRDTLIIRDEEERKNVKERENAKTIVLPDGSSVFIAPISTTSKAESKTFDLIIIEEAQDINDKIMKESIWPMGAARNAPRVYVGTAGTQLCHFRTLGQQKGAIRIYYDDVVKQRREVFEETSDARHLIYEQYVKGEIEKYGRESDEIQRPYFGKWLIGTGQFTTEDEIDALVEERNLTYADKQNDCFAGLDTAKHPDKTVLTILRWNPELKKKQILSWCELSGENYKHQFDVLADYLSKYNVLAIAIDSTGQGDFMPDMFEAETEFNSEVNGLYRVNFSRVQKDKMYKNLKVSIQESLTTLPNLSTRLARRFRQEMLDLQQRYAGQLLVVEHPDDPNAHDDYADSWALAEWAFAKWQEENDVGLEIIDFDKNQRKVIKDENTGQVTDYWPDSD